MTKARILSKEPQRWASVAAFDADVTAGYTAPDGAVVTAGPVQYQAKTGANVEGLRPGWVPFGDVYPDHWNDNTTPGTTDMTAAILAAANRAQNSPSGRVRFFGGRYGAKYFLLDSLRGVDFIGASPGSEVAKDSSTYIQWLGSDAAPCLMELRSCSYLRFQNITFFSNSQTGKEELVKFSCNDSTTTSPRSPFANTGLVFEDCAFSVNSAAPMSLATSVMKDIIASRFVRCNFSGSTAIVLGRNTSVDPATGLATIPDGRAVNLDFDGCIFRGDIIRERITQLKITNSYFGKNSVPFATDSFRVSRMLTSGNEEIRGETLINNSLDSDGLTHCSDVFYRSPQNPPANISPSLVALNNQITGVGVGFLLRSGSATIQSNSFVRLALPGVTKWVGVQLANGLEKFTVKANNYAGLVLGNVGSTNGIAVEDLRTSQEDGEALFARSLPTDVVLTNNSFTTLLTRTVAGINGGLASASFSVTITSAIDTVFTARLTIDGVVIPGAIARETTNTTATKTFTITLPPRVVALATTDRASSVVIALQVQQSSGATFATIRSEAYALGVTHAELRLVTS